MRIANNIMAMNAHRNLMINNTQIGKSVEKLSSGLRINRAGDDAAGLAISEKMRAQIRGLRMASKNAQDGISLVQTAEGALNETQAILHRMRELAVQASSDTNTTEDRVALQKEMNELIDELDGITDRTEFNTMKLLSGSFTNKVLHIGANAQQQMTISIDAVDSEALSVDVMKVDLSTFDPNDPTTFPTGGITTQTEADGAIKTIQSALDKVSDTRAHLGAVQNRLEHTIANLDNAAENLQAAESRIRDVDMAHEMMAFTKHQILQQASTAMLAQANLAPQSILQLLG